MAAGTPRLLAGPVAATGSNTNQTLYTAPANTKGIARLIVVANTDSAARTYRLAQNGTSATAANAMVFDRTIAANSTDYIYGPFVFKATDTLQAAASVAAVTFTVHGDEQIQTA